MHVSFPVCMNDIIFADLNRSLLCIFLQRDPIIAKQLFSSLFSAILKEMGKSKTVSEQSSITHKLLQDFNRFLNTSFCFFPPFVSCIQVGPQSPLSAGCHPLRLPEAVSPASQTGARRCNREAVLLVIYDRVMVCTTLSSQPRKIKPALYSLLSLVSS